MPGAVLARKPRRAGRLPPRAAQRPGRRPPGGTAGRGAARPRRRRSTRCTASPGRSWRCATRWSPARTVGTWPTRPSTGSTRCSSDDPGAPALVCLHHYPVPLHTALADTIRLAGEDRLAAVISRHPQVVAVLCGHAHTAAATTFAGRPLLVAPGVLSTGVTPWDVSATADYEAPPAVAYHIHWRRRPPHHPLPPRCPGGARLAGGEGEGLGGQGVPGALAGEDPGHPGEVALTRRARATPSAATARSAPGT